MIQWYFFRLLPLLAILASALGCVSWPSFTFPKPPDRSARDTVPARMIQSEFSPAETAKLCLAAGGELDAAGHAREAIAQYERARQLDPTLAGLSWRLGVLFGRLGENTKADTEFRAACAMFPENANLLNDYGYFLVEAGWLDQAESRLRRALEIDGSHPQARSNLGILLARQGRLQESFDVFAAAVGPAAAHHNIGVILAQQGKTAEAKQAFHQALAISPGLEQSRGMLTHVDRPASRYLSSEPAFSSWR